MNKIHPLLHGFAGAAMALLAAGCQTKPIRFTVAPSDLNHAYVTYAASTNSIVMMEFFGTGYCALRKSATPGVAHPLSPQSRATTEIRRTFSGDLMNNVFQSLVNTGVYDKEPKDDRPLGPPYISVNGRIQGKSFQRVSRTPEFLLMATWMRDLFEKSEEQTRQLR